MLNLLDRCIQEYPEGICIIGNLCGYFSSVLWFLVLLPQLAKNYRRKSVEGLSLGWAMANFLAALLNGFFIFSNANIFPLFTKISAGYMPIIEFFILVQFAIYLESESKLKDRIYWIIGSVAFIVIITIGTIFPSLTPYFAWAAIVLWSIELIPQIYINQKLRSTRGQSTLSLFLTFLGKTTDFGSAFSLDLPDQYLVLAYFSSTQAYIDISQFFWFSHKREYSAELLEADDQVSKKGKNRSIGRLAASVILIMLSVGMGIVLILATRLAWWSWLCVVATFLVWICIKLLVYHSNKRNR